MENLRKVQKEALFKNDDDVKATVASLLVGSNDTNEFNNLEAQNVLNTLQERVNFGIASVKTKHFLNMNIIADYYRYITLK